MNTTSFQEFLKTVNAHLDKAKSLIAITQGSKKLAKNTNKNKYNWSKQDIINEFGSVDAFFHQLPNKGFSDGALISFRFVHGTSTRLEAEATLNFPKEQTQNTLQTPLPMDQNITPPPAPIQQQQQSFPPASPQLALGYVAVQQDELIDLKVLRQRYNDLEHRLKSAESDRDDAKSDLRTAKEDFHALKRKLETIEDKHEWALEKQKNESKKFWESEQGKTLIVQAPELAAKFMDVLNTRTGQIGMGNPIANFSEQKIAIVDLIKDVPKDIEPIIYDVLNKLLTQDGFYEQVNELIKNQQIPQA